MEETIGRISGFLMVASIIPYLFGVYTKRIVANPISWGIWTLVGFAFLVSSVSAGVSKDNLWPIIFGFVNPLLVSVLALWKGTAKKPEPFDWACATLGVLAITAWFFTKDEPTTVRFAMYIAVCADVCAGIPTARFLYGSPQMDRPLAWILFTTAWALALTILPEWTPEYVTIPLYMFTAGAVISYPVVRYRVVNRLSWREWF
ncbi:MAG: hypothetical protein AAB460_02855 [Patescibacteria group bacterium]